MAKKKTFRFEKKDKKKDAYGLFIPGGILMGMGFGFVYNNMPAGMFIGLGAGFILMAIGMIFDRR